MIPFSNRLTIDTEKQLYTKTGFDNKDYNKVYNDVELRNLIKKYKVSLDDILDGLKKVNTPIKTKDRIEKEMFDIPSEVRQRVYDILNIQENKIMKRRELEKLIENVINKVLNESKFEPVFNRHLRDYKCDFTIEFNVKNPNFDGLPDDIYEYELETYAFTERYSKKLFNEIISKFKSSRIKIKNYGLGGRSGGWFILICDGEEDQITDKQLNMIESIVEKYFRAFNTEIKKFYKIKD